MNTGDKVKMGKKFKRGLIKNDCKEHVDEFGKCIGIVEDMVWPDGEGDECNVRWLPSKLRYGYSPDDLTIIEKNS